MHENSCKNGPSFPWLLAPPSLQPDLPFCLRSGLELPFCLPTLPRGPELLGQYGTPAVDGGIMENSKKRTEGQIVLASWYWVRLTYICLFMKDEPNLTPKKTERFYKKLLNKHGIKSISQMIPLQTLKRSIKPIRPSSAFTSALYASVSLECRLSTSSRTLLLSRRGFHRTCRSELLYMKTERSVTLPIFSSFVSSQDEAKRMCTPMFRQRRILDPRRKRHPPPLKPEKKETHRIKVPNKVQDKSGDEISLLVPVEKNSQQRKCGGTKHATGKKSPKKSPGPNTPLRKKRKAFPAEPKI
ncbi:hypothetical protein QTO34_017281 [Cnephaeus nilssonii]|uniref:Uncharacterized protein n=1 Tax=Cnephaeus nilssonii TaxID=3371016 RepID=A0AA40I0P9_CNENI|nr:hypothetical protein QTO34_017281 [Eptesicus nilssonii]